MTWAQTITKGSDSDFWSKVVMIVLGNKKIPTQCALSPNQSFESLPHSRERQDAFSEWFRSIGYNQSTGSKFHVLYPVWANAYSSDPFVVHDWIKRNFSNIQDAMQLVSCTDYSPLNRSSSNADVCQWWESVVEKIRIACSTQN